MCGPEFNSFIKPDFCFQKFLDNAYMLFKNLTVYYNIVKSQS